MKIRSIVYTLTLAILFAGCAKDNYEAPQSFLTGKITYQGTALGLRSNGVQLELWQHGFELFTNKIQTWAAQDGTYSAQLFDGAYKLTMVKDNGPWVSKPDSIDVTVKGNTVVDFPVEPYILVKDVVYTKSVVAGVTNVSATFSLQYVNVTKTLATTKLYLSSTSIIDNSNTQATLEKKGVANGAGPIAAGATSVTIGPLPLNTALLANKKSIFARIGVQTTGITEYIYSPPVEIPIP